MSPLSGVVSWGYDDRHRLDEETVAGETAVYGYDSGGRLTAMGTMTATYDPQSARLATTTLGDVTTTVSYDGFGDVSGVLYEASNSPVYEVTYTRDTFGRVETKTETRSGSTALRCYEYEGSDRLAAVYDAADSNGCTGTQLEAYTYDLNGNRASVTNSAGTVGPGDILTGPQDRLFQHGDWRYAYNDDGQMQRRTDTSSGDVWEYTYDVMGNLLSVDPPGADPTITYVTDARNRRVGKRENGVLVQGFLYGDQLNPIAELDGSGALVSRFVYGTSNHVPDYMVRGGVTYRFMTDHLGSVVGVYDVTNGAEVQSREYDAYGRIVSDTTSPGFSQPFGFAGGLYDEDTGLVRFGARDYRPEVGSWAAKDPLRFDAGDGSLYGYCWGDPNNLVDPSGRVPIFPLPPRLGRPQNGGIGGVVSGALEAYQTAQSIRSEGHARYPGTENSCRRHVFGSGRTSEELGPGVARLFGVLNEIQGFLWWDLWRLPSRFSGETAWSFEVEDLLNNEKGIAGFEPNDPGVCEEPIEYVPTGCFGDI